MITHVPILPILQELYRLPRGRARFDRYLALLKGDTDDVALPPLVPANPMAREHVSDRIELLLNLDVETLAADAVAQAGQELGFQADFRHGLTIADDVMGSWTNRYTMEAAAWFTNDGDLKRQWMTTLLWAGELPSRKIILQEVRRTVYRAHYYLKEGRPETLGDILAQEGGAAHFAGLDSHLDPADLAYSIQVIQPMVETDEFPIQMAVMYGDETAALLGYPLQGLSHRAGFAAALVGF